MRIIVTTGPTREYVDSVRFISNASSGKMGAAVAVAAIELGHQVTLLLGAGCNVGLPESAGDVWEIVRFTSVDDLRRELDARFDSCDVLVMSAAVGDFRVENKYQSKIPRSGGPITLNLIPTEDVLAGVAERKTDRQKIIAFAVEDGPDGEIEAKARDEMQRKGADYVVLNTPAAMGADESRACILSADGVALTWAPRTKTHLAEEIVKLLG